MLAAVYLIIGFDAAQDAGQRLPPEVRAEIALLAPASVTPGSIVEEKLANGAVSTIKIAEKAVDGTRLADGAVGTEQIALGAVDANRLAPNSVTGEKCGVGVMRAADSANVLINLTAVPISSSAYASLSAADPNKLYLITAT